MNERYRATLSPDPNRDSNCSICWHASFPVFTIHGWTIFECRNCQHRFTPVPDTTLHTASHYGDSYFSGGGAGYADYLSEGSLLKQRGVWYSKLLEQYDPPGKDLLGVGCAAGFILDDFEVRVGNARELNRMQPWGTLREPSSTWM